MGQTVKSSNNFFNLPTLLILLVLLSSASTAVSQNNLKIVHQLVPNASLPCTPEETDWWTKLQSAGLEVYKSGGADDARKAFETLIERGHSSSFQPPIADRRPIMLNMPQPEYTEQARINHVSGEIELKVEFLPDGSVGDITPLNHLGDGLDENAITAARRTAFLPAVKNRQFVKYVSQLRMSFSTH